MNKENLTEKLNIWLPFLVIVYVFFLSGQSIWQNWQLKNQHEKINIQIDQIKKENQDLENLILYYQSDSFKEVEARRKLGYKKTDEQALIVPVKKQENFQSELLKDRDNLAAKKEINTKSNWIYWWEFFFGA